MCRVLVTGANGFLGHHLVEHILESTPWDVVAMVRIDEAGDVHRLLDRPTVRTHAHRVTLVCHDLRYPIERQTAERIGCLDFVAHLAANADVAKSLDDPRPCVLDNVVGTCNLLEYYRRYHPFAVLLNLCTAEVYGPVADGALIPSELDPWRPPTPYAATKAGQAALGISYANAYALHIVTVYTMALFGERQPPRYLIPTAISRLKHGQPVPVYPSAARRWLYVRDAAEGISFLLQRGIAGEQYNLAGWTTIPNEELVKDIAQIMGVPPTIERIDEPARPGHAGRYAVDTRKLARLGWTPQTAYPVALRKTVEYALAHPETLYQ